MQNFLILLIDKVKNRIKTSRLFWSYRHLVDRGVWDQYFNDHASERRNYYSDFVVKHSIKSVFEFGCASGPNLENIRRRTPGGVLLLGYDINKAALGVARQKIGSSNAIFIDQLSVSAIKGELQKHQQGRIGLTIFDRVLYLLSEREFDNFLSNYSDFFEWVVVDDFHSDDGQLSNDAYSSKNYKKCFKKFDFSLVSIEKSEHLAAEEFFEKSAKRLIFKRNTV